MRPIKQIHAAEYHPIADLITYSPMPSAKLRQVDPFIFLDHHGFQTYSPKNNGLPFGPHPHRGMETVTFVMNSQKEIEEAYQDYQDGKFGTWKF